MLVLGALFLTASCSLHDDNEVFDTPAAQRIEESIAADKALLESATNGWELHLWMGEEYSAGGYTYLMKFKNDKVTVASDIADPDYTTSSSYDIIADAGPVLTINTYNTIFHYLANPERDGSQLQQDYEFIITRTTNDSIYLRGKKYGNKMVMTRMQDNVTWEEYISKLQTVDNDLILTYVIRNGSDSIGTAMLDNESRTMDIEANDTTANVSYYVSTTGVVLQHPINIGGSYGLQNFNYDADAMTLTSPQSGAQALTFNAVLPDNYMHYEEFAGNWLLHTGGTGDFNLTLTPNSDHSSFTVTGLGNGITAIMTYQKTTGSLNWMPQRVGTATSGNDCYTVGWSLDPSSGTGLLYYGLDCGFNLSHDLSQSGTVLTFEDITGWGITSFYLAETTGIPSSSTWVGTSPGLRFTNTAGRSYPYLAFLLGSGYMRKVE